MIYLIVPPDVSVIGSNSVLGVVGDSITLSFNILNASPMVDTSDIQWTFTSNSAVTTVITGVSTNGYSFSMNLLVLTIIGLTHGHEGNYTLRATNPAGISQATITLQIEG